MPKLDDIDLDLDLINGELSRRSLKAFVETFWPFVEPGSPFIDGWFIDAICDHLANLQDLGNLLINCGPRMGKSNLVSVFYPAWQWLHNPAEKYLYSSYAIQIAERDSVKCRRLISSDLYQKCYAQVYRLNEDENTKRRFSNDQAGERLVSSIEGSTTGEGGTITVFEEPHAVDEADSESKRNTTLRWFTDTWLSRLNPGGTGRVVCGHRIHKDDVSGFILENYRQEWTHLCLPYEYRPSVSVPTMIGWKDPRTEEGQELWPERFSPSEIAQLRRKPKSWSSQWNQNPVDASSCLFKPENVCHYDETDSCYVLEGRRIDKGSCWTLAAADLALALHSRADYTAIIVVDISREGFLFVKHVFRERIPGTQIIPKLKQVFEAWTPAYIILEETGFQKVLCDQARADGLPIRSTKSLLDKKTRSIPLQARFEARQVWLPKERPWLTALETELLEFPNGSHDDMVDALSCIASDRRAKVIRERPAEAAPVKSQDQQYREAMLAGMF
jgi:predicted phage terminase large subunit-like protein